MTYRELRDKLQFELTSEQLDCDVTALDLNTGEVVAAIDFVGDWSKFTAEFNEVGLNSVREVLDDDHPYLTIIAP